LRLKPPKIKILATSLLTYKVLMGMTHNSSSPFIHLISTPVSLITKRIIISSKPDLCSTPTQYRFLLCCHLSRPPTVSSLKITDRSFRYSSSCLWNQLPDSFLQPHHSCLDSPPHSRVKLFLTSSSAPVTPSLFHSVLKTYLFNTSFQPQTAGTPDCLHGQSYWTGLIMLVGLFSVHFSLIFWFGFPSGRLSVSFLLHVKPYYRIVIVIK